MAGPPACAWEEEAGGALRVRPAQEVGAPARLLHPLPAWPIAALLHWSAGFSPFYRWGTEAP